MTEHLSWSLVQTRF